MNSRQVPSAPSKLARKNYGGLEAKTEILGIRTKGGKEMAQARSISLSQFTNAVQAAVKAAVQKHPKFKVEPPQGVHFSYLIRGFPVPENVAANLTLGETQAFANEIAAHLGNAQPEALAGLRAGGPNGVIYSSGRHVILGIPAAESLLLEK
jgi:hypothetical protein